jgi:hypothetical protein
MFSSLKLRKRDKFFFGFLLQEKERVVNTINYMQEVMNNILSE